MCRAFKSRPSHFRILPGMYVINLNFCTRLFNQRVTMNMNEEKVKIVPMGGIGSELVNAIVDGLAELRVVGEAISPVRLPRRCYNSKRRQFLADCVLESLAEKLGREPEADKNILGVTDRDLYAEDSNFVFGRAKLGGRVALISTYRLDPTFYGKPEDKGLLSKRAVKEAVHEVCHSTYGLEHCNNPSCVMYFPGSILDVDGQGGDLCGSCATAVKNRLSHLPLRSL